MKLTKPQQDALIRVREYPVISEGGGLSPIEWGKHTFRCRTAPDRQGRPYPLRGRPHGRLHPDLRGVSMIPRKKTLVIAYKSGRVERVKFDTPNEAQENKEKLAKFEAIVSVEAVA